MKTLATVALSIVVVVASLVLLLSTVCAFSKGMYGRDSRWPFVAYALAALIAIVGGISGVAKLKRKK